MWINNINHNVTNVYFIKSAVAQAAALHMRRWQARPSGASGVSNGTIVSLPWSWSLQFGWGKCSAWFVVAPWMSTRYSCEKVTHNAGPITWAQSIAVVWMSATQLTRPTCICSWAVHSSHRTSARHVDVQIGKYSVWDAPHHHQSSTGLRRLHFSMWAVQCSHKHQTCCHTDMKSEYNPQAAPPTDTRAF